MPSLFQEHNIFGVVGLAVRIYLSDPLFFVLVTVMIYVPVRLVDLPLGSSFIRISLFQHSTSGPNGSSNSFEFHSGISGTSVLATMLTLAGIGIVLGITSRGVAERSLNRTPSIWGSVRGIGWAGFLALVVCAVISGLVSGLGLALLVIPGIIAGVLLSPFGPVTAIERPHSVFASLARAAVLVSGRWWYVCGALVVVILLAMAPEAIMVAILVAASKAAGMTSFSYPGPILGFIWSVISGAFFVTAVAVIYLQLRVRREKLTAEVLAAEIDNRP